MLFRREIYLGLCALLGVSLPALAGGDVKPQGYSTTAPNSNYHASSSGKNDHKPALPEECADASNLSGKPTDQVLLGEEKRTSNKDHGHVPHLKFDIEVQLPRRRNLPPVASVGELSVDLNNGTTRLAAPGHETRSTKCR